VDTGKTATEIDRTVVPMAMAMMLLVIVIMIVMMTVTVGMFAEGSIFATCLATVGWCPIG